LERITSKTLASFSEIPNDAPGVYIREDEMTGRASVIHASQIYKPDRVDALTGRTSVTYHKRGLLVRTHQRVIRTYIPLFVLYKITEIIRFVGPAQMSRKDIGTTQYSCEGDIVFTNMDMTNSSELNLANGGACAVIQIELGGDMYVVRTLHANIARRLLRAFYMDSAEAVQAVYDACPSIDDEITSDDEDASDDESMSDDDGNNAEPS
jgi:hypothetical protein